MANEEHVKILKQGVDVWNKWREENSALSLVDRIAADLGKANFGQPTAEASTHYHL